MKDQFKFHSHGVHSVVDGDFANSTGLTEAELKSEYFLLASSEEEENLLMEAIDLQDFDDMVNPGIQIIEESISFDNLSKLKTGIKRLVAQFAKNLESEKVKLVTHTMPNKIKVRRNKMYAYAAIEFSFSDGQAIKVLMHSPQGNPLDFDPKKELVSFAHALNGRDISHLFASKKNVTVAKMTKIMTQLLLKNSEKFQKKAQAKTEKRKKLDVSRKVAEGLETKISAIDGKIQSAKNVAQADKLKLTNLNDQITQKEVRIAELKDRLLLARAKQPKDDVQPQEPQKEPVQEPQPEQEEPKQAVPPVQEVQEPTQADTQEAVDSAKLAQEQADLAAENLKKLQDQAGEPTEPTPETSKEPESEAQFAKSLMKALVGRNANADAKKIIKDKLGDLPILIGSEKQVTWANDIRESVIDGFASKLADIARLDRVDVVEELLRLSAPQMQSITEAKTWIDERDKIASNFRHPAKHYIKLFDQQDQKGKEPEIPQEAKDILSGKYDDDPAALEAALGKLLEQSVDEDLLEKVSSYYTQFLNQMAIA
jgi:hypothetical protein